MRISDGVQTCALPILGRLCQPRLQGAASRERQVAERIDREVLVAGGGMVGLALAVALAKAGLEVTVADRLDPSPQRDDAFDGRSSAIARGSTPVLQGLGLWTGTAPAAAPDPTSKKR